MILTFEIIYIIYSTG